MWHPATAKKRPARAVAATAGCLGLVLAGAVSPAPVTAARSASSAARSATSPSAPADRFTSITAGPQYVCGVQKGYLVCWGVPPFGPAPTGTFVSVAGTQSEACALRRGGLVVCWGEDRLAPAGRFVQISRNGCGVERGGPVVCWWDVLGKLHTLVHRGRFVQASGGQGSVCAISRTASLVCWSGDPAFKAPVPRGRFLRVSVGGDSFACALRVDRTVACWGDDTYGQTNAPGGGFDQISAGEAFGCGVRTSGAVVCWGAAPQAPAGTFSQVASGESFFACALRAKGRAVCWGDNSFGQTEVPAARFAQVSGDCAVRIDGSLTCLGPFLGNTSPAGRFLAVSEGAYDYDWACALRVDRSIVCWSFNRSAYGDTTPPGGRFTQLSAGGDAACAVRPSGSIVCWGRPFRKIPAGRFRQVSVGEASGDDFACAVRLNGFLVCWGDPEDWYGRPDGQTTPPGGRFTQINAGWNGACGLRTDGAAACWGEAPTPPRDRFTQVAAGCGLRPDHVVICWDRLSVFRVRGAYSRINPGAEPGGMCAIQTDGGVACASASLMPYGLVLPAAGPAGWAAPPRRCPRPPLSPASSIVFYPARKASTWAVHQARSNGLSGSHVQDQTHLFPQGGSACPCLP